MTTPPGTHPTDLAELPAPVPHEAVAAHGHAGPPGPATHGRSDSIPERTRTRLERSGRTIAGVIVAIQVLAVVVSLQLSAARYLVEEARFGVHAAEVASVCLYAVIAILALVVWRTGRHRLAVRLIGLYLVILTIQAVLFVTLLVVGMTGRSEQPLWYLGDLVSVLAFDVAVFTAWYWIIDAVTPGGAFVFAAKPGAKHEPGLLDYVFLSFNTTFTFGPTTESLLDPKAKLAMMLETGLSVAVLVVLAARIVSRT